MQHIWAARTIKFPYTSIDDSRCPDKLFKPMTLKHTIEEYGKYFDV